MSIKTMFFAFITVLLAECRNSNTGGDQIKAEAKQSKSAHSRAEAENFVKRLDELGYFKYANTSDIESLKKKGIVYLLTRQLTMQESASYISVHNS